MSFYPWTSKFRFSFPFSFFLLWNPKILTSPPALGSKWTLWKYIHSSIVALPAVLPKVHHRPEPLFFVLFCFFNNTASAPITSGTPHRWGAVTWIRKPGSAWLKGTPTMDLGHMNVVLKWMYLWSSKSIAPYRPVSPLRQIHPLRVPRFPLFPDSPHHKNYPPPRNYTHFLGGGEIWTQGDSGWTLNLHLISIWEDLQSGVVLNLRALRMAKLPTSKSCLPGFAGWHANLESSEIFFQITARVVGSVFRNCNYL